MAFVQDNITHDDPKPKIPEKTNEEQANPNVETPPKEKDPPTNNEKNQAQAGIHDSSSNTSLRQEEILALKRNNQTEALKILQILRKLLTGSRSS